MRAILEEELKWRQEELAFLKNQLASINVELDKDKYRKSMVLMLYSHFEGFIKISFQTYIQFINDQKVACKDVNKTIAVSSLNDEFHAYEDLDRKCKYFKKKLPNDTALHRYYRRVDFLESIDGFMTNTVSIDDSTINTESNLWSIVMKKNLFKIGLPIDTFDQHSSDIDALVNRRNAIAHGNSKNGVSEAEYSNWENKIYRIMSDVNITLYDYAYNKKYLCNS